MRFRRKVSGFGQGRLAITVPPALLYRLKRGELVEVEINRVEEGDGDE